MNVINYRALIEQGDIKNLTDLLSVHRQEILEIYNSRLSWPDYDPTTEEMNGWIRIYSALNLVELVPFQTYILIVNRKKAV